MTPDLQRHLARFKRLPQVDDVWEGAALALPTWVEPPGRDPYRPAGVVWVSTTRRIANLAMADPDAGTNDDLALSTLAEMGTSSKRAGYRPRALRVRDERLAASLETALADASVSTEIASDLPAVDAFL